MKKKLALPVVNSRLSEHFGHARSFQFFEIEDNVIVTSYTKEPPPHQEGVLPRWLADEKVSDLLVGGIGPKAVEILYANGINVYVNVEVDAADNVALDFINGDLKFGQNYCHH
jgi:predicted Fe-Mo cluster-binding NifX family protein